MEIIFPKPKIGHQTSDSLFDGFNNLGCMFSGLISNRAEIVDFLHFTLSSDSPSVMDGLGVGMLYSC